MEIQKDEIIRPTLRNLLIWEENKPICNKHSNVETKNTRKYDWKRKRWSKEEDALLNLGVKEGLRWQEISVKYLPARLSSGCASHWKSMVRKHKKGKNDKVHRLKEYKCITRYPRQLKCRWTEVEESLLKQG